MSLDENFKNKILIGVVMEGDLAWGSEHTIPYTDDALQNCTPETYVILLTNVTQIHSIKKKEKCNNTVLRKPILKLVYDHHFSKFAE